MRMEFGSGSNGSCCVIYYVNYCCSFLNLKGEIKVYCSINFEFICKCMNNGKYIDVLMIKENCFSLNFKIMIMMSKNDSDIQEIHENLVVWYLRHEY